MFVPKVSVLIPTRNRPQLIKRAIKSVQSQTFQDFEIVVVIDGPDPETESSLKSLDEPRLRWVSHTESLGSPSARITGAKAAAGDWIAYLDDDDEWMPHKLERQIEVATHSSYDFPIVISQVIGRTPKGDFVWPRQGPKQDEPVSEYLFVRKTLFYGEALLQTSTYFLKREFLLANLPDPQWRFHEEWRWLLYALQNSGTGIEFIEEPLAIWYRPVGLSTKSKNTKLDYSLSWIRSMKHMVTPKAYGGFIMSHVGSKAALGKKWRLFWPLLSEAFTQGPPGILDIFLYLLMWIFPRDFREFIRNLIVKRVVLDK